MGIGALAPIVPQRVANWGDMILYKINKKF